MTTTKCFKCDGLGFIKHLEHVDGGICFQCEGTGECELREPPVVSAATKAELVAGVRRYISRGLYGNSSTYEMACRLLQIQDSATARALLDTMPAAMRSAVIAKGFEIRAENV